jgi:uncharacterized protein (DUF1919 family)
MSGKPCNTPFMGLFLYPDCYLRLLEDLDFYLAAPLQFLTQSRHHQSPASYPVGLLGGDVEIHFLHYSSEIEAREKWSRRLARLQIDRDKGATLLVKMDDRDNATVEQLQRFHELGASLSASFHLISFATTAIPGCANHIQVQDLTEQPRDQVADGLTLYAKRYRYFDLVKWVRDGKVAKTSCSKALAWLS